MQNNNAAKFAFYYVLSLVALIFLTLSTGMVIFQIINKYIVDVANFDYSDEVLRFAISAIIIAGPIYYFVTRQIMKSLYSGELEKDSQIRKWLGYLVLLVSSVVIIGWLIGTLNTFFNGELTMKFILKAVTVMAISGSVFYFYFYDIKRLEVKDVKDKVIQGYFYGSLVVVLISLGFSLTMVQSPTQARNLRLDNQTINSLSSVDGYMNRYYSEKGKLPADFQVLIKEYALTDKDFANPVTNEKFDFKVVDKTHYELCAVFNASNKEQNKNVNYYGSTSWVHDAGKYCFTQKIFETPKAVPVK